MQLNIKQNKLGTSAKILEGLGFESDLKASNCFFTFSPIIIKLKTNIDKTEQNIFL